MAKRVKASVFKAKCFNILDRVEKTGEKIIITKRNIPVAQLVPIEKKTSAFGKLKGTIHIKGDLLLPIDDL